mmetsp:Transcript_16432/g.53500  ORF Transcript_16432/g.53500 Transcript_16432/m.53500 type:complete len:143 (+) Transcript_16432:1146-1574(+)
MLSQAALRRVTSWETKINVPPKSARVDASHVRAAPSRWFDGSSRKQISGSLNKRRAKATRICHPPLSSSQRARNWSCLKPRPLKTFAAFASVSWPVKANSRSSSAPSSFFASLSLARWTSGIRETTSSKTLALDPDTAVCSR